MKSSIFVCFPSTFLNTLKTLLETVDILGNSKVQVFNKDFLFPKPKENEEQKQLSIEPASFFKILKYNKPEAGHMLAGTLFAGIAGVRSIAIAFLIAEVIGVCIFIP